MRTTLAFALLLAVGCHHTKPGGGDGGAGGDMNGPATIVVTPANSTLTLQFGGTATQAFMASANGKDVTSSCAFSIDATFGSFAGATFTALQHAGTTMVSATCPEGTGSTGFTVKLTGSTTTTGTPATASMTFGSSTVGTDTTKAPSIEYPIDGALAPANFPTIDAQWTTAGNDLFHLQLTSTYLDLDIYTSTADNLFDTPTWQSVLASSIGDTVTIVVEGLVQASPQTRYQSAPVKLQISSDTIDNTTLYWWVSSQSNLVSQNFGSSDDPSVVRGDCTACHSLSRSGTRIGYSRCVGGDCSQQFGGFMKASATGWVDTMNANDKKQPASYSTFSPVGNPFPTDDQAVAILATNNCTLTLYDPDEGMPITSNLDAVSQHDGSGSGTRCGTMPDWSADGNTIAFASGGPSSNYVDVQSSVVSTMTYTYAMGTHTFGEPKPIVSQPITLSSGTYSNFFFPSFSPDSKYIVFDAAKSAWRDFGDEHTPASRLVLTDPSGAWTQDLTALNGGDGDYDITWPHWAPNSSAKYYWVVFSSERDYGHLLTGANTDPSCVANGNKQCKQIWLGAVDVSKLNGSTAPTADPSFPPLWLPGQDIKGDNISPYWSVPTNIN